TAEMPPPPSRDRRHARKHLGWALDAAAETAGASDAALKAHRGRVLTADDPTAVRRHLADAYADFASGAQAGKGDCAWPQEARQTPYGSARKAARAGSSRCPRFPPAPRMPFSTRCRIP